MGTDLLLAVRIPAHALTMITLNNVNLNTKADDLKREASGRIKLPNESVILVYCGCILEDECTLESYGLKNGSMVHVLKKKEPEPPSPVISLSEESILQLASTFKSFNENPALRSALHRVSKKPIINDFISSSRGLYEDTFAMVMLRDPELMEHFADIDTVRRIAEAHPLVVIAAQSIAVAVHREAHNVGTGPNSAASTSQSTAYSYSLDNLSDDEEMAGDSSQSSDSTQPTNIAANSTGTITTAQLAAALSRARSRNFPLSNSPSSTSASSSSNSAGVITSEMFTQAMQQAFASAPATAAAPPPPASTLPPILPPVLPQFADLQRQLAQMHEIGLQDDTVNVQALQFTNGDVQAAIELVFSGFSDD